MYSFEELATEFKKKFETKHFPSVPESSTLRVIISWPRVEKECDL